MKASIILPNLNGAGWLQQCIESLYAMTETDFELIVVDNGSTDESLALARTYQNRPNFVLVENQANTGFAVAVNQGIKLAKAEYVLLFNNDAFARPEMLANLLRCIQTDEKIFGVQCLMLRHWQQELADDAGDYVTLFGWAMKRGDGFAASRYQKQKRIFSACGGATLYRRSVFDEIGFFDESFFAYFEDVDISWRANNYGYKNILCPDALCSHIAGATTGGLQGARYNDFKSIQSGRNSLLMPYKNQPLLMLLVNLVPMGLGYLLKMLVFHLRGYGKAWNKGMREGFSMLFKIKKPPFHWRNLPNYIWAEWQLLVGTGLFIDYRIGRFTHRK